MPATQATARVGHGENGAHVLLAAHQALTVGGIGTFARGLAEHVPEAMGTHGNVFAAMPKRHHRATFGALSATARLWHEQGSLACLAPKFDLVHLCDLRPILFSRTPFIITVHDVNFLDRPQWVAPSARKYKARMLRAALRKRPAAIICISEHTRSRLLHHFPGAGRSEPGVIYPGVDLGRQAWTGDGDPSFFLTVSTILPRKNHLGLLRAFREARSRGLRAQWVVAGPPGPLSGEIVATLAKEPGVRLLGEVDEHELDRLYREALFVATPSSMEGFGYPPLEAMARGTPTLTSNAGSLPEIVGDAGPLLSPDDARAWAQALKWLAEDGDARRELSEKGRRRSGAFSWQRASAAIVQTYREKLQF